MRKLSESEIARATSPRATRYVANVRNPSTPPQLDGVIRSVILDAESVFVDRISYAQVCAKVGMDPKTVVD
ncbi:MAG: hypothetical protein JWN04_6664 [Myxococcaceae bacterium]|nr:hypothetical protein [Myxococcaceae bacterium]